MRTKQDSTYIKDRIARMQREFPLLLLTEHRREAIKQVLKRRYPQILDLSDDIIKDIAYVDRQLRLVTQGKQEEIKKKLEQQFIKNEL
jgi:uncharacterized protein YutD